MYKLVGDGNNILFVSGFYNGKPDKNLSTFKAILQAFDKSVLNGSYIDFTETLQDKGKNTRQTKKVGLERLKRAINENKPKIIFTLGADATKELTLKPFSTCTGKVNDLEGCYHKCPVIALPSVNTLFDSGGVNTFVSELKKGLEYYLNPEINPYKKRVNYELITDLQRFKEVLYYVKKAGIFVHDYETDGGKYWDKNSKATVLGFCFNPEFTYIIPIEHPETCFNSEQIKEIYNLLEYEIFSNPDVIKVAHNLKYEIQWHKKYGVKNFDGEFEDTMLMSHICDETTKNGLKDITGQIFKDFEGYESEVKTKDWFNIPLKTLCEYNAIDCHLTYLAYVHFENKLLTDDEGTFEQYYVYKNIAMFAFWALLDMEYNGALIDVPLLKKSIEDAKRKVKVKELQMLEYDEVNNYIAAKKAELYQKEINKIEEKINDYQAKQDINGSNRWVRKLRQLESTGVEFNINFNSVPQLTELLFTHEQGFKYSYKGTPNTGKDGLNDLDSEFVDLLLGYRTINKMCSTYYEGIERGLDEQNKIHASFKLHGTKSGRLSCAEPNLQNMPSRTAQQDNDVQWAVKQVKKLFSVPKGYTAVQVDFSQAELRLIASFSGDENMIGVYNENKDIHAMTGATIAGMSYEEFLNIDKDTFKNFRNIAKSANFGQVYGISDLGYIEYVKNTTGKKISKQEAEKHRDGIFKAYPKLPYWWKTYESICEKNGFVRTLFGRKRRLPEVWSKEPGIKSNALRAAINSPIQGTGGEWTAISLGYLRLVLPSNVYLFNTVHDSIFLYIPDEMVNYVLSVVKKYTETPPINDYFVLGMDLKTGMKIDVEASKQSWGDMQSI